MHIPTCHDKSAHAPDTRASAECTVEKIRFCVACRHVNLSSSYNVLKIRRAWTPTYVRAYAHVRASRKCYITITVLGAGEWLRPGAVR